MSEALAPAALPGTAVSAPRVRRLGRTDYESTWRAMREFTAARSAGTADEVWLTEHPPVYTLGVAGRSEHLPRAPNGIPVVRSDRGGQITYHGPGQVVAYLLLDLRRRGLSVRPLVRIMERAVIDWLADHGVAAQGRAAAPGVYVERRQDCRAGTARHRAAAAITVSPSTSTWILPRFTPSTPAVIPACGVTTARELGVVDTVETAGEKLASNLMRLLP